MPRFANTTREAITKIIEAGAAGSMKTGDLLEVWTFGSEVQFRPVNPQVWMPELEQAIAHRLTSFFKQLRPERQTRMDRVFQALERATTDSTAVSAYLFTDGQSKVQGTPWDSSLNEVLGTEASTPRRAKSPILLEMEFREGRWTAWRLKLAGEPGEIASFRAQPQAHSETIAQNLLPPNATPIPSTLPTPVVNVPNPATLPQTTPVKSEPSPQVPPARSPEVLPPPSPVIPQPIPTAATKPPLREAASPKSVSTNAPLVASPAPPSPGGTPVQDSKPMAEKPAPTVPKITPPSPSLAPERLPDRPPEAKSPAQIAAVQPLPTAPIPRAESKPPPPPPSTAQPLSRIEVPINEQKPLATVANNSTPTSPLPTTLSKQVVHPPAEIRPKPTANHPPIQTNQLVTPLAKPVLASSTNRPPEASSTPIQSKPLVASSQINSSNLASQPIPPPAQRTQIPDPASNLTSHLPKTAIATSNKPSGAVSAMAMTQNPSGPEAFRWMFAGGCFLFVALGLFWMFSRSQRPKAAPSLISQSIDQTGPKPTPKR